MKAQSVLFPRAGEVTVDEVELAEPGPHEVLCRARASLVSTGTELTCLAGDFDPRSFWAEWVQYPFSPGYSMVSEVVQVGSRVTTLSAGDRVFSYTPHATAFVLGADEATLLPAEVSDEQAVWSSLAVTTQWAVRRAAITLGEVVAVVGLGLLGQLLVRYLRIAGARRIIAIDTDAARGALARDGGADEVLSISAEEAAETLAGTVDAVFDVTGHPAVLAPASELVRELGRLVLVGDAPRPSLQHLGPRVVRNGARPRCSRCSSTTCAADGWTPHHSSPARSPPTRFPSCTANCAQIAGAGSACSSAGISNERARRLGRRIRRQHQRGHRSRNPRERDGPARRLREPQCRTRTRSRR
jgi:2-desacetyl-2-hydroxyethyl bacteriochlorophyllide A dehydrogenase